MRLLVDIITMPETGEIIVPCLINLESYLRGNTSPDEMRVAVEIVALIDYWVQTKGNTIAPEDLSFIEEQVAASLEKLQECKRAWKAEEN